MSSTPDPRAERSYDIATSYDEADAAPAIPPCRTDVTPDDLAREADRAVLYGAVLAAQRPQVRLKPAVDAAARALVPGVQDFLAGRDTPAAAQALAYAQACGGEAFLRMKRDR